MSDFIADTIREAGLSMSLTPKGSDRYDSLYTSKHGKWARTLLTQLGAAPPTLEAMLYFHALNAQQVETTDDVLDWAADYGHDLTRPNTVQRYRDLVAERDELRKLLSESTYLGLLAGLAISQAIGAATPR